MLETIDNIRGNYATFIEDIENDIYYDINNLCRKNSRLYTRDRFKQNGQYIDVISPVFIHHAVKNLLNCDSLRYLLSLYPEKEDLKKARSIIIRPRYIELNGAELISLYIRREKIVVIYLHQPFSYPVSSLKFCGLSENLYTGIYSIVRKGLQYNDSNENLYVLKIPVLWHILSTVLYSDDDKIEKFVIKRNDKSYQANIQKFTDISFYYSRLGY